jgi:hypothetical protein
MHGLAWYDRYLKGARNGVDTAPPVTIAAAAGVRRAPYSGLPPTRVVRLPARGAALRWTVETFGVSTVRMPVLRVHNYPRLVPTVLAGSRVITHGAIGRRVGVDTIRLADFVQHAARGARLTVRLGPASVAGDPPYPPTARQDSIALGRATLARRVLRKRVG